MIKKEYTVDLAEAKLCQDIILLMLSKSKYNRSITIKGGVVMSSLSKNIRRATVDIDFDFIKYPLTEKGIQSFIDGINGLEGIDIKLVGKIEDLRHQDYQGKRIKVKQFYLYFLSDQIKFISLRRKYNSCLR